MRPLRLIAALVLACLGFALCAPASDGAGLNNGSIQIVASEATLKAAYLLNFVRFTDWPPHCFPHGGEPLIVGLVGDDPFGEVLDRTLESKVVNTHPLVLRRFQAGEALSTCHVLFISRSEEARVADIVRSLHGQSVLVVGDSNRFLENGGTIKFFIENDSVGFALNLPAAERAGLKISSKLLRLAKVFKAEPRSK